MAHPGRYYQVALQLRKLPPEVVHKILSDICILKILEIICTYDVPYIEECIRSHLELGTIFTAESLPEIKAYSSVYLRLCSTDHRHPHPVLPQLNVDAFTFCAREDGQAKKDQIIQSLMKVNILDKLRRYKPYLAVLRLYTTQHIPETRFWDVEGVHDIKQLYETIDSAEATLNAIKSGQLRKMAELVQRHRGCLRIRDNQSQAPLLNEQHVVDDLLSVAKRMERRHLLSACLVGRSIFSSQQLYLTPYDRFLRLFIKTIERYPPDSEPRDESRPNALPQAYPEEMKIVLEGFTNVYPRDVALDETETNPLPRTRYTEFSREKGRGRGTNQPAFTSKLVHLRQRSLLTSLLPAPEKELKWLEAFLSVCEYMRGMKLEWKKGQTVAEYWRSHCS